MGFFSEKEIDLASLSLNKYLIPTPGEQNLFDSCTIIHGDISSCSNMIIKGQILGNIESKATVIVGKDAIIEGSINAKALRIEGQVQGDVKCELLEVRKSALIKAKKIEANNCYVNGQIEGDLEIKEELLIEIEANLKAHKIKAQSIISNGIIKAKAIKTKSLHLQKHSITNANINSTSLICDLGAKLQGIIQSTKEKKSLFLESKTPPKKEPKRIYTKKEQVSI